MQNNNVDDDAKSTASTAAMSTYHEEEKKGEVITATHPYVPGGIDISDLDRKWKEFQAAFDNLGKAFAEKMALALTGGKHGVDYYTHKPQAVTPKEAAKFLVGKKKIMIVTGAGLSAASGIPTFRGDNGFWSRSYGGVTDPTEILTSKFFYHNPQLVWQWHYDFIELADKCKPNKGHYALLKF